ncbi:MAG: IS110 family transposase [Nocardioidaceae bacterium]|nr:IS110 family transposase [Nocardioidaceae bacterium]
MAKVFIGVDPHKLSATIEVMDRHETVLATGRFGTDKVGYAAMRRHVAGYRDRTWAVEGSNGAGRPLAQRLLADGEHVVDVPAKLSARARLLDTGHNRKTDAHDAHAVAVVAVRTPVLRVLSYDADLEVLRMLVDHRDELTKAKVQAVNRLHRVLSELVPGQTKKDITPLQAKKILAGVRPRDVVGKTRKRLAAEHLAEMVALEAKIKASSKELKALVVARGSHLMDLTGVGPVVAARVLADVGDVARFTDRNRFASWTGTAPLDASSGEQIRHRLSRAGNRKVNHVIHIAAACQIRVEGPGRAYYRRKLAAGKTRMEAMRCLKRRIADAIYRQLVADARAAHAAGMGAGPGGHRGASLISSATGSHPHTGTSDQPLPGPASPTLRPTPRNRKRALTPTS